VSVNSCPQSTQVSCRSSVMKPFRLLLDYMPYCRRVSRGQCPGGEIRTNRENPHARKVRSSYMQDGMATALNWEQNPCYVIIEPRSVVWLGAVLADIRKIVHHVNSPGPSAYWSIEVKVSPLKVFDRTRLQRDCAPQSKTRYVWQISKQLERALPRFSAYN
jgi:hypothetical protein